MDFAVPMIQVELSQGSTLEVGTGHTFTCSISGADKLNPSTTYQWTQNNGTHTSQDGNNSNDFLLSLSDYQMQESMHVLSQLILPTLMKISAKMLLKI